MESNKIKTVIVDDESKSVEILMDALKNHPEVEVLKACFDSAKAPEIILSKRPDLLFLDIQMPDKDGFQVLEEVNKMGFFPKVIFITGYDKFAIRAIKHAALDYLLKPVNPEELSAALSRLETASADKLQNSIEQLLQKIDSNKKIKFNTRTGFIIINTSEIVCCKADRNYTEVYLNDGRMEVLSHSLKELSGNLNFEPFFRISRSILINLDYLVKADRTKKQITLQVNDEFVNIPLSGRQIKALALI